MTDTKKHHVVHDKPLLKSLLSSFVLVVIVGLAINQLVNLFVEHHLPLEHSTVENASTWKHLEWKDGIQTLRRPIAGTQLYAHRAVTTVDVPLGKVMKVIRDSPHQSDWIKVGANPNLCFALQHLYNCNYDVLTFF